MMEQTFAACDATGVAINNQPHVERALAVAAADEASARQTIADVEPWLGYLRAQR